MSIYLDTAKKQIEKGTVGLDAIKSNLTRHFEAENKAKWNSGMQVEYDELYPLSRAMTDEEVKAKYDKYILENIGTATLDEYIGIFSEYLTVQIDYSEDENYVTFEEWLNETRVVSEALEATYDEDGIKLTPYVSEVTELVRPYTPPEVSQSELDSLYRKYATPKVITMRQARLALLQNDMLDTVDNAIANSDDKILKIEWEYATDVEREWSNLVAMATSLGITSDQLDDLFILGASL